MKRQEAIRVLTGRLRSSRVRHSAGFDSGQMQITMGFNAVYAPDHRIESCIWFYEDTMEARCYYSTIIPYDFFGLAPLETLDYITICCPELLDRLALPIYCVLLGKETADGAISHIEREFLKT